MDKTNQWKTTAASPSTDDDHRCVSQAVERELGQLRTPPRAERVARFSKGSDMAAFTSSQWKARDRDGVRCLCD